MSERIAIGSKVTLELTAFDEDGTSLDEGEDPGTHDYEHGAGQLPPGLERALEGLAAGDAFEVEVAPEDGFGVHDSELYVAIPRGDLPDDVEVHEGDWLPVEMHPESPEEGEQPEEVEVLVVSIDEEAVIVDLNHPLAGQRITFKGKVLEVN